MSEKAAMAHRALWLTVIAVAIEDYRRGKLRKLYFRSRSFQRVCEYADVKQHDILKVL